MAFMGSLSPPSLPLPLPPSPFLPLPLPPSLSPSFSPYLTTVGTEPLSIRYSPHDRILTVSVTLRVTLITQKHLNIKDIIATVDVTHICHYYIHVYHNSHTWMKYAVRLAIRIPLMHREYTILYHLQYGMCPQIPLNERIHGPLDQAWSL